MRVSIIGAGGFVGQQLAGLLVKKPGVTSLVLNDLEAVGPVPGARVVLGSFAEPDVREAATEGADAVVLLASVLGGAAEQDYALARSVNVDATLSLFEHIRLKNPGTRVVFASTIAVLPKPLPPVVTDQTVPAPVMVYGAHKLMMEVALSHFARRQWLDGVSLRLSGVVARDGADAALKTAFLSRLFWCVKRGEDITLPVAPDSRIWLTSVRNAAQNFSHALDVDDFGADRAFTLPAIGVRFDALIDALKNRFPDTAARVSYKPQDDIVDLFGSYPDLQTGIADKLKFTRDNSVDELVANAFC